MTVAAMSCSICHRVRLLRPSGYFTCDRCDTAAPVPKPN